MSSNLSARLFYGIPLFPSETFGSFSYSVLREGESNIEGSETDDEILSKIFLDPLLNKSSGILCVHSSGNLVESAGDDFLYVKSSAQGSGEHIEIDTAKMKVEPGWDEAIQQICEKYNRPWLQPRWIMVANYG